MLCQCICREWLDKSKKTVLRMAGLRAVTFDCYLRSSTLLFMTSEGRVDSAAAGLRPLFVLPLSRCIVSLSLISWSARGRAKKIIFRWFITWRLQEVGTFFSAFKPTQWDECLDLSLSFPWTASLEGNKQNSARKKRLRETVPVEWHFTITGRYMTFDWKRMHAPEYFGG